MHQLVDAKGNGRQEDEEDDDDDGDDVVALCHGDGLRDARRGGSFCFCVVVLCLFWEVCVCWIFGRVDGGLGGVAEALCLVCLSIASLKE